ncbi:hypothetical protein MgSA37_01232 [Mucilaginibacter gotjawali]|uniref:Uncharacterized protein n=2 Tax=Mucilaginibacter gotjawali TaxID=1550579 RepID=A0A839SFK3_9SPHI|nr:hypothetical protein [Mucilaginibacter gotjawali]BAU53065.1 hypothetical protein MgSA37_01232 [Mucilaginibacter gotjawali]
MGVILRLSKDVHKGLADQCFDKLSMTAVFLPWEKLAFSFNAIKLH